VAIVGGTGSFGRALAERLATLGYEVVIGSRDPQRAAELGAVYGVEGKENSDAVRDVDLVVLATKSTATIDTARDLAEAIGQTPVLCVASDLSFEKNGVLPGRTGTSLAEEVAEILAAPVAAGLQTLAAVHLTQRDAPDQDALICGDDVDAKRLALELADRLVAGRAIDAGPLANARALEGLTAVILNVNKRYRTHAGIRVTGLE
jgi:NADPH-dependent F420 reductase